MSVPYYGDFSEDSTVYIPFNTFDSNDPSASVTVTDLADADIKVHKDGGTTQIATDGASVAINFDSITGNHLITIDTSVHADYATGSDYLVRLEGITVDAATLNVWIGSFSIENRHGSTTANTILTDSEAVLADTEAAVPVLTDTEAILADSEAVLADTEAAVPVLTDTEAILADSEAIVADTGELQTDWTNGGRLDLILDAILADTETSADPWATSLPGAYGAGTAGNIVGNNLDAAVSTVVTDTEAILVDSEAIIADTELVLADTGELQTDWTDGGRLDLILDAVLADTEAAAPVLTDTEAILADSEAILDDTGTNGVLLAAAAVDAVWDEDIVAAHTTADTAGQILADQLIKSGQTDADVPFVMVDETDGITGETGLTPTFERSIDGGATWTTCTSSTFVEVDNGAYVFQPAGADTTGKLVIFRMSATGARDTYVALRTSG